MVRCGKNIITRYADSAEWLPLKRRRCIPLSYNYTSIQLHSPSLCVSKVGMGMVSGIMLYAASYSTDVRDWSYLDACKQQSVCRCMVLFSAELFLVG